MVLVATDLESRNHLILHHRIIYILDCSEWLKDMGLELKPSKTRITHTLYPEKSEDSKAGLDFLGYHIQQFPAGKYRSSIHPSTKEKLGFKYLSKINCALELREQGRQGEGRERLIMTFEKYTNKFVYLLIQSFELLTWSWQCWWSRAKL